MERRIGMDEVPQELEEPEGAPPAPPGGLRQFPCKSCGAGLEFAPGVKSLKCGYCGAANEIEAPAGEAGLVAEEDLVAALGRLARDDATTEVVAVRCGTCGAESQFAPDVVADRCPFCASPIVAMASTRKALRPRSLLPFAVTKDRAGHSFRQWIGDLWWAPNDLKKLAAKEAIRGVYVPAWTYDARTTSSYVGQRGDDYWETQTYMVRVNGRSQMRTRQVRKTRWRPAAGVVRQGFDDVLVIASAEGLADAHLQVLEPWDLKALVPYQDEFLSGFVAQSYTVSLERGFAQAKEMMAGAIRQSVAQDIGGDHQRIHHVDTQYAGLTYKHILLPVWVCAYRYQAKVYRFLVNARTGEVSGDRPYSVIKITLAVIVGLIVAAVLMLMLTRQNP